MHAETGVRQCLTECQFPLCRFGIYATLAASIHAWLLSCEAVYQSKLYTERTLWLCCFLGHALQAETAAATAGRPGAGGEDQREVFESALKSVDATFQNLDSSEISLTDVSHYFDSDPTKLVSGLRSDGKLPSSYIADTTTANAQVCHS